MRISILTPTIRGQEGLEPNRQSIMSQTFDPDEVEWLVDEGDGKVHDLNAAFNRMLRRAKGELIVFMEDYTKATTNGLIKFWEAYKKEPNVLWTAPLGKTLDWVKIDWDWRAYADAVDCEYTAWEIDWAACPKKVLYELGGFDERLDEYWSCDNVSIGRRAYLKGYKFKNLFDNPAVAFDHDKTIGHPFRKNFNPKESFKIIDSYRVDTKLDYLI